MKTKLIPMIVMLTVLAGMLACSTVTEITSKVEDTGGTAQAVITQAQGIATQGSELLRTAQAVATEHPGFLETVQAVATQGAPLGGTLQALATDNPELAQTLIAFATQAAGAVTAPFEIPVYDPATAQNVYKIPPILTYSAMAGLQSVVDFYNSQLPALGWAAQPASSVQTGEVAFLTFVNGTQTATVNLSFNPLTNMTVVLIYVQTR